MRRSLTLIQSGCSVVNQSISGNVAKISPTTDSAPGRCMSSDLSQAMTSPLLWEKPLLMASNWPRSGSLTHNARRFA